MPTRIVFTGERQVELADFDLRPPREGEVVVRSLYSLMSTGTENIAFNRNFDTGTHWDAWVRYPFLPGYLTVVAVEDTGEIVLHRAPHASHNVITRERCTSVPDGVDQRDGTMGICFDWTAS